MNFDFEEFKKAITWFIRTTDNVYLLNVEDSLILSKEFQRTFPKLTELIQRARILNLKINNQHYKLFSWTNKDNHSCGWLNKIEKDFKSEIELIDEHKLLLNEIGGIQESYNQPSRSLCNNQNFMFIESDCSYGIGGWDEYYEMVCEAYEKTQIDFKNFVCFVQEANGDVTLYDPINKGVMLFAHDHCFKNVKFVENQPEYTFHTIHEVTTFVDYVEKLASEWTNEII